MRAEIQGDEASAVISLLLDERLIEPNGEHGPNKEHALHRIGPLTGTQRGDMVFSSAKRCCLDSGVIHNFFLLTNGISV